MKKILLSLSLFAFTLSLAAQTPIFSEDFESVITTPNSVANTGIGDIPASWTLYNVDGKTPNSDVSFVDKAWKVYKTSGANGNVAISTSYYSPVGKSDDWMVSPQITLPNSSNITLIYDVAAFDEAFPDNYEVRISTTGNTPADFTGPALLSKVSPGEVTEMGVSLDNYAGQDIYIAFRNVANNKLAMFIDNIRVVELPSNDMAMVDINLPKYFEMGVNQSIKAVIKNFGGNQVNAVTIEWSDGVNTNSHEYTGLNISPYGATEIPLQIALNYTVATEHEITVKITDVNGVADTDPSNNEASTKVYTVSKVKLKKIVIEEGTGTWCGWCPRGIVAMEYMYSQSSMFPNFIGIAVHNGDPMVVGAYNTGAAFSGFPGSNVDRVLLGKGVSSQEWKNFYNARRNLVPPAEIALDANINVSTRKLTATVSSDFYTKFSNANFRLALVVVEDGLSGTTSGWKQKNYYSITDYGNSGPMGGFESKPGSVSGMVYDRVGVALIGGYSGQSGSVPSIINDEDHFTYDFTYTLPTTINFANASVVALLIDQVTGEIVNASESPITTLGISENHLSSDFKLFPNPATDQVNVIFSNTMSGEVVMNIYTLNGKVVQTEAFNSIEAGEKIQINTSNLTMGEYLISFSTPQESFVKNLIVK